MHANTHTRTHTHTHTYAQHQAWPAVCRCRFERHIDREVPNNLVVVRASLARGLTRALIWTTDRLPIGAVHELELDIHVVKCLELCACTQSMPRHPHPDTACPRTSPLSSCPVIIVKKPVAPFALAAARRSDTSVAPPAPAREVPLKPARARTHIPPARDHAHIPVMNVSDRRGK